MAPLIRITGGASTGVDELTDFEKLDDGFCWDASRELDADELGYWSIGRRGLAQQRGELGFGDAHRRGVIRIVADAELRRRHALVGRHLMEVAVGGGDGLGEKVADAVAGVGEPSGR